MNLTLLLLAETAAIAPGSQLLLDTRTEGVRRQRAETVPAQARSALDSGNADLAERLAQQAQRAEAGSGSLQRLCCKRTRSFSGR